MLNINKVLTFIPVFILSVPILSSCNNDPQDGTVYLKVLNSEDYIYKQEKESEKKDLIVQFEEHMSNKGKKVKVIYDTFDTMENMYNTLKTGKTKYDLVCASEYMIQKLAKLDLIETLEKENIPNYYQTYSEESGGCSPFIREKLQSIPAIAGQSLEKTLDDYAVCYMWGTLGILYNPTYKTLSDRGLSKDQIMLDMTSWSTLWDEKYKKTIAIKDSMRDTYAIGAMHSFAGELRDAGDDFSKRNAIFNYGGASDPNAKEHINIVKNDLLTLRNNVFGFEVDSGKQDIVTGKIGIDTAWSGDAVHSMNEGDEQKAATLYYSIPTEGTNLWFDCWCMQKGANKEIANEFLNFISLPDNAIQNMDYIGYTSPIGGNEIFDYFSEKYKGGDKEYNVNYFFRENSSSTEFKFTVTEEDKHRQLAAQFPEQSISKYLMIMEDYGDNADLILTMWEQVKHESLPGWAIALLSVEVAILAGGITVLVVIKVKDKNRRKKRREKLLISK